MRRDRGRSLHRLFDPLRDAEGVIHLNPEIPKGPSSFDARARLFA
jgi:hypothetical protein